MKIPEVQKCCCCIPLETGAKIFGFLHLIFSGLIFALIVIERVDILNYFSKIGDLDRFIKFTENADIDISLQAIVGLYLLVGLYEKHPALIFTWILFQVTSIVMAAYQFLMTIAMGNRKRPFLKRMHLEDIFYIVVYTYVVIVMLSLYRKFGRNHNDNQGRRDCRSF